MAYVTEKIRHIGTDGDGKQLWRVKTSTGEVTEAVYRTPGSVVPDTILKPTIQAERDYEAEPSKAP